MWLSIITTSRHPGAASVASEQPYHTSCACSGHHIHQDGAAHRTVIRATLTVMTLGMA
jgi:hypothetical protein